MGESGSNRGDSSGGMVGDTGAFSSVSSATWVTVVVNDAKGVGVVLHKQARLNTGDGVVLRLNTGSGVVGAGEGIRKHGRLGNVAVYRWLSDVG